MGDLGKTRWWDTGWQVTKQSAASIIGFLVVGALLALIAFAVRSGDPPSDDVLDTWYARIIDPVLGVGTFVVAVAVWLRTRRVWWEESLPKVLDVTFLTPDGETFLQASWVPLTDPGDIRPLA